MIKHVAQSIAVTAVFLLQFQGLSADTIFGSRSFGCPVVQVDGRSWGMGGAAVAVTGENFSTLNPAVVAKFYRSGLTGMMIPEYRRPRDAANSVNLRSFTVPIARAVFPLRNRFVASGGIKQDYDLDWRFDGEKIFDGETLNEYISSEGSLFSLYGCLGRSFGRHFSAGIQVDFHKGRQERIWYLQSSQSDEEDNLISRDIVRNRFSGQSFTAGVLYQPFKWLGVGFSYKPGYDLSIDETLLAGTGYEEKRTGSMEVPGTLAFGLSVQPIDKLTVGFDVESSSWSSVDRSRELPFAMNDYRRLSLGLEFVPSRDPLAVYWKKWPLRTGIMYRTLPSRVDGRSVDELSLVFGVGIGLREGRGRFDFFTQYTRRGSLDEIGLEERVIAFGISLSGFEKWVPRRKGRPI